jgi:hypothetical protein
MAITLLLRMFRLCPFYEKSGGCFPHLASQGIEGPDEPPENCFFEATLGGSRVPVPTNHQDWRRYGLVAECARHSRQ